MKWSYVLFLPALVSVVWPLVTMQSRRTLTRAQLLLGGTMLIEGAAMAAIAIFFRGRAGSLFVYHYMFEILSVMCGPLYYMGACSLTEPRDATLRQRQVFWIPLLFIVGLTAAAYAVGPLRYERLCYLIREGLTGSQVWDGLAAGDRVLLAWSRHVFLVLIVVVDFVLVMEAARKMAVFQERFNGFYADAMKASRLNLGVVRVLSGLFLPMALAMMLVVLLRPPYYKYYLILLSLVIAVVQWMMGRAVHSMAYDARYLAQYIKKERRLR